MKHNYEFELTKVVKQAQRDVILTAIDAIIAENEKMEKMLSRGQDIWAQSQGERWNRIRKQRDKIWIKIFTNHKAVDILWNTLNEFK